LLTSLRCESVQKYVKLKIFSDMTERFSLPSKAQYLKVASETGTCRYITQDIMNFPFSIAHTRMQMIKLAQMVGEVSRVLGRKSSFSEPAFLILRSQDKTT